MDKKTQLVSIVAAIISTSPRMRDISYETIVMNALSIVNKSDEIVSKEPTSRKYL